MKKAIKLRELGKPKISLSRSKVQPKSDVTKEWKTEIDKIKIAKFHNFEQALDALISAVINKMKFSEKDQVLKDQLRLVLGTDPYVLQLLDPKYKKR